LFGDFPFQPSDLAVENFRFSFRIRMFPQGKAKIPEIFQRRLPVPCLGRAYPTNRSRKTGASPLVRASR